MIIKGNRQYSLTLCRMGGEGVEYRLLPHVPTFCVQFENTYGGHLYKQGGRLGEINQNIDSISVKVQSFGISFESTGNTFTSSSKALQNRFLVNITREITMSHS